MVGRHVNLDRDWWLACDRIISEVTASQDLAPAVDWYAVADGVLGLCSECAALRQRWSEIYGDCRCSPPAGDRPVLRCHIFLPRAAPQCSVVHFQDGEPLDAVVFNLRVLPDRRLREIESPVPSWRMLAREETPGVPLAACKGDFLILDRRQPWEAFIAHYALHRVLRLQKNIMVFHASSAKVGGSGVLMMGPKKSGKTTLSMALAARGHGFLGDEFAAVRRSTHEVVPFRRAVSIRPGPCLPAVEEFLREKKLEPELYPDGTTRIRANMSDIFPAAAAAGPALVRNIFFLRSFSQQPRAERFIPASEHLRLLTPQGSTLWNLSPGRTVISLMCLLNSASCYFLELGGTPLQSAQLVEAVMEAA